MNKPQWITLGIAVLLVVFLFIGTEAALFGESKPNKTQSEHSTDDGHNHDSPQGAISTDSILFYAKQNLPQDLVVRLAQMENSIVRGDVAEQKLHLMHQLARYWADSGRAFSRMAWYPFAYYTGEAARLENSQKSLSFAAHLFLNALGSEESPQLKQWEALQAKDLFERSLKLAPENDSSKIGLGASMLYSGTESPMTGIGIIREVVQKDSTNVFGQQTLGEASLFSGQLDKAVERFKTVLKLQPANWQIGLLLADTYLRMDLKEEAAQVYQTTLPHLTIPEIKKEVEQRITQLKTK